MDLLPQLLVAGIVIGNRPTRAHNTVVVFLDAATWLAQIVMFVLLGLLISPERLLTTFLPALAVALVLMFVARPVAVFLCLAPFPFPTREKIFISWVGLRGATPIVLATFPLVEGVAEAPLIFDVVFFVVLASVLLQGTTIGVVARLVGGVLVPPGHDAHLLGLRVDRARAAVRAEGHRPRAGTPPAGHAATASERRTASAVSSAAR